MKRMFGVFCGFGLMLAPAILRAQTQMISLNGGVLEGRALTDPSSSWAVQPGSGVVTTLGARGGRFTLEYGPARNWTGVTFVVMDLRSRANRPVLTWVGVFRGSVALVSGQVVLPPNRTVRVALPTISPRQHGITSWPPIAGADFAKLAVTNTPTDLTGISMFRIQNRSTVSAALEVQNVFRITQAPNMNAMVDSLGQIQSVNWPGKINYGSTPDIPENSDDANGVYPYSADAFGATMSGPTMNTGNRWRVAKVNGRWSLFAPSGRSFFSFGVNEVGIGAPTALQGREYLFENLPSQAGGFAEHFGNATTIDGQTLFGFNQYTYNLELKYGANWQSMFHEHTLNRLRTWGFNTLGANSTVELQLNQIVPSTLIRPINGNHQTFSVLGSAKRMHDPFDPAFPTSVRNTLTQVIIDRGRHPYHLGIFVDNELPWGDSQDPYYRFAVAMSVLRNPSNSHSKRRLVSMMQTKYRTIQRLNAAWGSNFASWTAMQNGTHTVPTNMTAALRSDLVQFTTAFANAYFRTIRDTLRSLNYTGLYLGCRFAQAGYSPEAVNVARQYVDVLSFNVYAGAPEEDIAAIRQLDFPVMISEVGFPSSEMGRTLGYLYPTLSADDQAEALRLFMRSAASWNNVVGIHWYNWADLPATGRVWDGNNASSGLVSVTDQPHQALVTAAREGLLEMLAARGTP